MIIDHDKKYIFISVPKTASISIHFSLGHGDYDGIKIPEPDLYHMGIADVLRECTVQEVSFFKFAFVRNPWARLLSLYHDFQKRGCQYSRLKLMDKPLLSEFKDFEDLCLNLDKSEWFNNIFFRPQFDLLSVEGDLMVDFVGRFENLNNDFAKACEIIGITTKLCKMNTGSYDTDYRKYYTAVTRDIIRSLYHKDITEFGYEF